MDRAQKIQSQLQFLVVESKKMSSYWKYHREFECVVASGRGSVKVMGNSGDDIQTQEDKNQLPVAGSEIGKWDL